MGRTVGAEWSTQHPSGNSASMRKLRQAIAMWHAGDCDVAKLLQAIKKNKNNKKNRKNNTHQSINSKSFAHMLSWPSPSARLRCT